MNSMPATPPNPGVRAEATQLRDTIQVEQTRVFDGIRQIASLVAASAAVRDGDAYGCQTFLDRSASALLPEQIISVTDRGGTVICSSRSRSGRPSVGQPVRSDGGTQDGPVSGRRLYPDGSVGSGPAVRGALSRSRRAGSRRRRGHARRGMVEDGPVLHKAAGKRFADGRGPYRHRSGAPSRSRRPIGPVGYRPHAGKSHQSWNAERICLWSRRQFNPPRHLKGSSSASESTRATFSGDWTRRLCGGCSF